MDVSKGRRLWKDVVCVEHERKGEIVYKERHSGCNTKGILYLPLPVEKRLDQNGGRAIGRKKNRNRH